MPPAMWVVPGRRAEPMLDVLMIVMTLVFFALAFLFVKGLDRV